MSRMVPLVYLCACLSLADNPPPLQPPLASAPARAPATAASADLPGIWEGTLSIGAARLRIVFNVTRDEKGLHSTLDSPDQGAAGIPVASTTLEGDRVTFSSPVIGGGFEGTRNADFTKITGIWSQGGSKLPLELLRVEKAAETRRPQLPKKPYPYREEEVAYRNIAGASALAGTLTIPPGNGPFPAVLMITGSGPQDRDESIFGHKPFLVIADYLTRRGIVVLRVDDRGVGASKGDVENATSADFAGDVLAGVGYLRSRKEVDPKRIGLIGHSEGAIIAPMVAAQSEDVAFVVLLAAPAVPGDELLYEQGRLIASLGGAEEADLQRVRRLQEQIFGILRKEQDIVKIEAAAQKLLSREWEQMDEEERKQFVEKDQFIKRQMTMIRSAWFRYFIRFDPRPTLKRVRVPVLALFGEKDLQVSPTQNMPELEKALREGGNQDVSAQTLPGLNHLFQTAETGGIDEYGRIEETFSPQALQIIGDWIEQRTR